MDNSLAPRATSPYLTSGSRLAACAAAWCGVHCALTPILVVVAPALALSEGFERGAFVVTIALGALMVGLGPARGRVAVVLTFLGGAAVWGASLAGVFEPLPESATSAAGSLVLAGALLWSARICHENDCDVCEDEVQASRRT